MGKKSDDSSAAIPNYSALQTQQAGIDQAAADRTTNANRPNRITPWGQESWGQDAQGNWTQNVNLNPTQQASLDSQQRTEQGLSQTAEAMTGRVNASAAQPFDMAGLPQAGASLAGGANDYAERAGEAAYNSFAKRMDPRFAGEERALNSRLINQGFNMQDAGAKGAQQDFNMRKDDAYGKAATDAFLLAGQEGQRMQGMDVQGGQYQSGLRDQAFKEQAALRAMPINELNAILKGNQISMPNFQSYLSATGAPGANVVGAANDQFNAAQSQQAADNAGTTGLFNSAAALAKLFMK